MERWVKGRARLLGFHSEHVNKSYLTWLSVPSSTIIDGQSCSLRPRLAARVTIIIPRHCSLAWYQWLVWVTARAIETVTSFTTGRYPQRFGYCHVNRIRSGPVLGSLVPLRGWEWLRNQYYGIIASREINKNVKETRLVLERPSMCTTNSWLLWTAFLYCRTMWAC